MPRTADEIRSLLYRYGAGLVRSVNLKTTQSTYWSVTPAEGDSFRRDLNLNACFAEAPDEIIEALAVLCLSSIIDQPDAKKAKKKVREWVRGPGAEAFGRIREEAIQAGPDAEEKCIGSEEQKTLLRSIYAALNASHFEDKLPPELPLRFSNRMSRRLGHCLNDETPEGERRVREIALNIDLLRPENQEQLRDTMLHEMAHAEAWLLLGERGHGEPWKEVARRVGAEDAMCTEFEVQSDGTVVSHVPTLEELGIEAPRKKLRERTLDQVASSEAEPVAEAGQMDLFGAPSAPAKRRRRR